MNKKIEFTEEEIDVLSRFLTSFSTQNLDQKVFESVKNKIEEANN